MPGPPIGPPIPPGPPSSNGLLAKTVSPIMCMSFTPGLGWFTDVDVVWLVLLFFFAFPPDDPPPPEEPPEGNLKFPDILLSEVFSFHRARLPRLCLNERIRVSQSG